MANRVHTWRWWEIDKAILKLNDEFELVESQEYDRYKDAKKAWDALSKTTGVSHFFCRVTRLQNGELDSETLASK